MYIIVFNLKKIKMKNLINTILFCLIISASNLIAQSNITWKFKDKLEKGQIKTLTVINSNFSGFSNAQEITTFCQNIKSNPEISSCEIITNSGTNCDMKLTMKQPHDKQYYLGFAKKSGITNIEVNGNKKTVDQMVLDMRNKKK